MAFIRQLIPNFPISCNHELVSSLQRRHAQLVAFAIVVLALCSITYLIPIPQVLLYGSYILGLGYIISGSRHVTCNGAMLPFYLACVASILFNDIPSFFKAEFRFGLFCIITFLVGPFITSTFITHIRLKFFTFTGQGLIFLTLASFFARFIGLAKIQQGYWCGILNHSMLLGPVAGLSSLILFHDVLVNTNGRKKSIVLCKSTCLLICLITLIGASSRTALIATAVGSLYLMSKHFSLAKLVKYILIVIIGISVFSQSWNALTAGVRTKNRNSSTLSISSRAYLWQDRLDEFSTSPIIGIGYSHIASSYNVISTGQVEPGSSWLSFLSMTGLVGAFSFLLILCHIHIRCHQIRKNPLSSLLFAMLLFFYAEMCSEGFVLAAGNIICLFFWLLLGTIEAVYRQQKLVATSAPSLP